MKSIETRLKDIELKVKPDSENALVFILDEYDGLAEGVFPNVAVREIYIAWRVKKVREENKYNPNKVFVYLMDEKDVLTNYWICWTETPHPNDLLFIC